MNCGNPRNQIQCPAKRDEIIKQYIYISSMVGKGNHNFIFICTIVSPTGKTTKSNNYLYDFEIKDLRMN